MAEEAQLQTNSAEDKLCEPSKPAVARQNGQPLLAVVGRQQGSDRVLRWTNDLAGTLDSPWIALYVQTADVLAEDEQSRLAINLSLARELGAEVITINESDAVGGIARMAAQRSAREIIIEAPQRSSWWERLRGEAFVSRLMRVSPDTAIHLLRVAETGGSRPRNAAALSRSSILQYVLAVGVVAAVTLAAFAFTPIVGRHATALVFLLAIVLLALVVERGPTMLAAALSALSWDFFFLPPLFEFRIKHFEDAMLFTIYFVVALVLGQLTARIRAQEEAERRREERATALFLLTRELGQAATPDELAQKVVQQTEAAFQTQVAFLLPEAEGNFKIHRASSWAIPPNDHEVISWVFNQVEAAGRFTDHFQEAAGMYTPLGGAEGVVAVLGLCLKGPDRLSVQKQNLLADFSHQIALALDRQRLNQVSEKARLLAESERLSKTLLDSMSHEMRTPLAAIRSAAGNLAEMSAQVPIPMQREMIAEVELATERLNRLVGNVLEVSRLESGRVRPRLNECDVKELVHVAVAETEAQMAAHKLEVRLPTELPMVNMDFVLMQQVLTNLLSNAAFHTPPGTRIELSAAVENENLLLVVSDNGPGIPPGTLDRVFDKFYRAPNAPTGGTGLGLSLVKGFVEAHGGKVKAENRSGGGARFTLSLPLAAQKPNDITRS